MKFIPFIHKIEKKKDNFIELYIETNDGNKKIEIEDKDKEDDKDKEMTIIQL